MTRLKFQGLVPYPPVDKLDDWGLTPAEQETHVEQFRQLLEQRGCWRKEEHDYYSLLRFLRARNYEHDKAFKMWADSLAWRREFEVDGMLDTFVFHEREQFLMAYPQGYHKTDKLGRPIYIQLLGKIDINTLRKITTEDRMVRFHIQEYERAGKFIFPVCSRIAGRQIDQTFGIMDVKGVGISHLTGEVKRLVSMLTKYDQDNYPEMLGRICIINAPMVFKAVWQLIKPMLNPRTLNKIQICQSNYTADLLEWVDADNLPVWLGGRSKGTLLDDVGPWSDPDVLHRLEPDLPAAAGALRALRRDSMAGGAGGSYLEGEGGDGYQSPRSEVSFASFTSGGSSVTSGEAANGPPALRRPSAGGGDKPAAPSASGTAPSLTGQQAAAAAAGEQQQHVHALHRRSEGAYDAASLDLSSELIGAGQAQKTQTLVERVQALEILYAEQMQRLKGYMPNAAIEAAAERRLAAPEGSLLRRVDVLEDGLELLLRAQELSWQEEERRAGQAVKCRTCGGDCVVS